MPRLDDEIVAFYNNSRAAYHRGDIATAEKWYRRLRAEHGVDVYWEVSLPEHIVFIHPLGTVLGRADYSDFLAVYQNVGIGSSLDKKRPKIGRGVVLFPGSKVLGASTIGNNVFIEANTVVRGQDIPSNSIVSGPSHDLIIKPTKRSVISHFWGDEFC